MAKRLTKPIAVFGAVHGLSPRLVSIHRTAAEALARIRLGSADRWTALSYALWIDTRPPKALKGGR